MANCSKHKNPLINHGTSQIQRLLAGLDKNQFALVDEKDFADWIVFANEFASYINFYNNSNKITGNWQAFFSSDISAQLGVIAIQDIERYRIEIKERLDYLRDDDNKDSIDTIKIKLNELFSAILTLSKALDDSILKLPEETSLKSSIQNLVKTKLGPTLKKLIAYHIAADSSPLNYIDHSFLSSWKILNKQLTDAVQIINTDGLSKNWFDDTLYSDWTTYINDIEPDDSIFNNPLSAFSDQFLSIEHAANHNLFTGIFDTYLSTYTKIIQDAEAELLKTLESYDSHTPHYALFLSFLMLFRFTQKHINTLTQRHLDFYYKEVLRLQPRAAEANKVHVLGELAKQVDSYLLKQGTLLKAGKDSLKKDVNYQLDADTVFNKAKVAQLKTFYKASEKESIIESGINKQNNTGRVFASPTTNTDDGIESKLTSANKEWQPFVHKVYKEAAIEKIAMPKASLGFALASHYLYLTEGERKVSVKLVLNNNSALEGKHIECYLTAEKEWYKVESPAISTSGKQISQGNIDCVEISFILPGSAPAIVNYNAAKHGGTFNVALPILKIYLINDDATVYEYDALKDITITKTEIRVEVGMDSTFSQKGLKNLQLSNDFGVLDASKPFMPFGSQPKKDAGFVIGSKEIISKKNVSVQVSVEWAELPDSASVIKYERNSSGTATPSCLLQMLSGGRWLSNAENGTIASSIALFNGNTKQVQLFPNGQEIPYNVAVNYFDAYENLNSSTANGFIRLSLNSSFGHSEYLRDFAQYIMEKSPDIADTITVEPIEPYTPKIKSIYASYYAYSLSDLMATSAAGFDSREIRFFHIYPFGDGEQHNYLNSSGNVYLLPQFSHTIKSESFPHIGEFYIGIENLNPGEAVNILFQVMEGTTNPNVSKPQGQHVCWAFLSSNKWIEFKSSEYSDNTLQLVQSGIISFAIPDTATTTNTILPTGYIWLRAAITEAAEAVCDLISVDAQASVATFVNNENADDFLNTALPAGTVTKLKIPYVSLKKITQPYSSFGGRPKENDDHFYIRISERLRHKARAITVWDYEHLVLEAFPEIYKVKCLNHTQIEGAVYHEVKPGHVSIITIPSQQNHNDANPLKPYTQQSTLTKIEEFLQKRSSCFVNLHACQPQFEEIRLEFSLKLYDQYKDFTFYSEQLKEEITQFLSPWAFGNTKSIDFGGKIYKSVLINFIEERYYVDFITNVKMFVTVDETTSESANMEEISASTARSILVSVPASKHTIIPYTTTENTLEEICIDKNNVK